MDITTSATNTVLVQQIATEVIAPVVTPLITPILKQPKQPVMQGLYTLQGEQQTPGMHALLPPTHKVLVTQRSKHRLKPTILSDSAQLEPQQPLQQPLQQYALPHRAGP